MRSIWILLGLSALLAALSGCGGGSQSVMQNTPSGRATFTVMWPAQTRLIPNAASSIVVQIVNSGTAVASITLARPSGSGSAVASFPNLPLGQLTATATAYPQLNGTGTAQAQATVPLVIQANTNTNITLTMASTIDHIELTPNPATVVVGGSTYLTATAKDAAGNVVLLSSPLLIWATTDATIATAATGGRVSGLLAGTATNSVTDSESGKSASTAVTVSSSSYVIGGVTYVPTTPLETLNVPFAPADGGITTSAYKGYVLLHVTGVGQSYSTVYNDCFYLYTGPFTTPTNGHDGGYYQLAFGASPLMVNDISNNAINSLVGPLPAYNAAHDYMFVVNTSLTTASQLHFGVSDVGYSDNTGAYTIQVTQLVPISSRSTSAQSQK